MTLTFRRSKVQLNFLSLLFLGLGGLSLNNITVAQPVINPGFNDNSGWATSNDATLAHPGGSTSWSWQTPIVASVFVKATETVLPTEGAGMGITYAGSDSFIQRVLFPNAGTYTFSVDANAIAGTAANGISMVDGQFDFVVGGAGSSPINVVTTTSGWSNYRWTTFVTAGTHNVGVRNRLSAVYSIAYDDFAIIPEPATIGLLAISLMTFPMRRVLT